MTADTSCQSPPTPGGEALTVSLGWNALVSRFENARQAGASLDLDEIVQQLPSVGRRDLLFDLVQVDLEYRLKAGEAARVEEYLRRYPELQTDIERLLELIAWEFRLRRRTEPGLRSEDYLGRLPVPEEALRVRLAAEPLSDEPVTLAPPPGPLPGTPASPPGFHLQGELGKGGMGVVYRARQIGLGREVALKMIRGRAGTSEAARLRFLREARAVAQLKHPGIVPIYTIGVHAGQPYFVMELIEGGSLEARLDGKPWPPRAAAELVATLAAAVQHAHEKGIVHRDLKPANVLLDEGGVPHITDFGLARVSAGEQATVRIRRGDETCDGSIVGTPAYMAPEQACGQLDEMGPATDVFGLGAILYHLLTGRRPYPGTGGDSTLLEAARGQPAPVRTVNPRVSARLARICAKAMAAKREERYSSAAALEQALRAYLRRPAPITVLLWVVVALLVVLVALMVALGSPWVLWPWRSDQRPSDRSRPVAESVTFARATIPEEGKAIALPAGKGEALAGTLEVSLSRPGDRTRSGLLLDRPGALPLRRGDALRLRVRLDRRAYLYLVWLDSRGEGELLYPYREQEGLDPVPPQQPRQEISSPEDAREGWLFEGDGGLETVLLLAREKPLPPGVRLADLIGKGPHEPVAAPQKLIKAQVGGNVMIVPVSSPRMGQLLERLAPHFDLIDAVRFARQP
jgi:serine/threonine protein kinase